MSFKLKIAKASHSRSIFRFNMPHLQSAEFMQNNVIFCRNTVPSDHFKISPVFEGRCAALTNPSFINTEYHIRCFYVPYSVIWKRFDDWVNGNLTFINGTQVGNDIPTVGDAFLTNFFVSNGVGSSASIAASSLDSTDYSSTYDFILPDSNSPGNYKGYIMHNRARYWYKLLISLGYKFNFTTSTSEEDRLNALPLLAYFKIFLDYFIPSVRYNTSDCYKFLSNFYDNPATSINIEDFSSDFLAAMNEVYHCFYPSSYLTSSWESPVEPRLTTGSSIDSTSAYQSNFTELQRLGGQASNGTSIEQTPDGQYSFGKISSITSSTILGNPWLQRNAERIVSWLLRSRFVGSEKALNILSRFGVKPKTPLEHNSRFCGSFTQPLVVQDINALAQTNGTSPQDTVNVGDYAGKMFTQAQSNRTFEVNSDDYGVIIITSMITPHDIDYYQGIDRDILKTKPLQFYQPEFDSIGMEVLSAREAVSGFTFPWPSTLYKGSVGIGFVPRYSSYKVSQATVSGDFAVNSIYRRDGSSFHHFRGLYKWGKTYENALTVNNRLVPNTGNKDDINAVNLSQTNDLKSQKALLLTSYDKNQYNRIFNVVSDSIDHIYTMYHFNVIASRPMRSIANSLPTFDDGSDKVDVTSDVIENNK